MKNNLKFKSLIQVSIMIIISALTQVVSLLKSSLMATKYGATGKIDAYNVVYNITLFIFSFVATGITTVLIPAFVKKTDNKVIHTFLVTIYFGAIILAITFFALQQPILSYFAHGSHEFYVTGRSIILILLVSQFFNTYVGVTTAYFQCIDHFNLPKILTFLTSFLLVFLLWIVKTPTVWYLAFITGITTVANALLQLIFSYRLGMKMTLKLDFHSYEYKRMLSIYVPTIFSAGLYQINLLLDSLLSSQTGTGNVTILTYSNSIIGMVNTLIISNLLVYLYPKISEAVSYNEKLAKEKLFISISLLSFFVGVMIIAFFAVGKDLLSLLMLHGEFGKKSLNILYVCTCLYLIGFPFNVIRDIMYRFFYSLGDTRLTFYNSAVASVTNFVFSIILAKLVGVYGVILGTLISAILSMVMIIFKYQKRYNIITSKIKIVKEMTWTFVPVLLLSVILIVINNILDFNVWVNLFITVFTIIIYVLIILANKGVVYHYLLSIIKNK